MSAALSYTGRHFATSKYVCVHVQVRPICMYIVCMYSGFYAVKKVTHCILSCITYGAGLWHDLSRWIKLIVHADIICKCVP